MDMKYEALIQYFSARPFFETADLSLVSGEEEKQFLPLLSHWVKKGKVIQLRRGRYLLPSHLQKTSPHPFYLSNYLYGPSYVSGFTALEHFGLILEHTPRIQSVTSRATRTWETPRGVFHYQSLKAQRFMGYQRISLGAGAQQTALMASPEKALVDICLLSPGEWDITRWAGLRLKNMDDLDRPILCDLAEKLGSQKLLRGITQLIKHLEDLA